MLYLLDYLQPCVLLKPRTGIRTRSRRIYVSALPRGQWYAWGLRRIYVSVLPTRKTVVGIRLRRIYVSVLPTRETMVDTSLRRFYVSVLTILRTMVYSLVIA